MPATALDPRTALVAVDLQKGIANRPIVHPFPEIVARTVRLAGAFRDAGLPVVWVHVAFSPDRADMLRPRAQVVPPASMFSDDFFELVPELDRKPGDLVVTKRQWSAFYGTDLDLQLRRRGITGIVLTGISTSIGVDSTARGAYERGYNLTFASDAMTDIDAAAHDCALTKIFPRMGEIDTTEEILALLGRQA